MMEVICMYIMNHINDINVCGFGSINFELLHSIYLGNQSPLLPKNTLCDVMDDSINVDVECIISSNNILPCILT